MKFYIQPGTDVPYTVDPDLMMQLKDERTVFQRWAAYQNAALDSANCGHIVFLRVGDGCTFAEPPKTYPGSIPTQWAYLHIGYVDLVSGMIELKEQG